MKGWLHWNPVYGFPVSVYYWTVRSAGQPSTYWGFPIICRPHIYIIFDESSCKSDASSKNHILKYDATPSVFETILCESLFDLTKIFCYYETRNV